MDKITSAELAYVIGKTIVETKEFDDRQGLHKRYGNSAFLAVTLLTALGDLIDNLGDQKEKPDKYQEIEQKINEVILACYEFMS